MATVQIEIDDQTLKKITDQGLELTGEYREPKYEEWYLNSGNIIQCDSHTMRYTAIILRPIPKPWNGDLRIPSNWWICNEKNDTNYYISSEKPKRKKGTTGWYLSGTTRRFTAQDWALYGGYQFPPGTPPEQRIKQIICQYCNNTKVRTTGQAQYPCLHCT